VTDRPMPPRPGPDAGAARLAEMLRVDHAGELAAGAICRGQRAALRGSRFAGRSLALIADVEAQEARHQARFEALLLERRARPSLLAPVWRAAGFTLGAATALIGESAAHACTEAVETVIEAHYGRQVDELAAIDPELSAEIGGFRADEVSHRDAAKAEGADHARGYRLLSAAIRAGCRLAIKIAEKI
jgi:ubiquinone biosynthesis monooxygenase Coq7